MKRLLYAAIVLALFMLGSELLMGQPPSLPTGGDPPCWPPPCVPIDGGIGFLLTAGVAFGFKRSFDQTRKKKR